MASFSWFYLTECKVICFYGFVGFSFSLELMWSIEIHDSLYFTPFKRLCAKYHIVGESILFFNIFPDFDFDFDNRF